MTLHFTEAETQNLLSWLRLSKDEEARAMHNAVVQRAEGAIVEMMREKVTEAQSC